MITKHSHPKLFETNLELHCANVLVHNDFINFDKILEKFVFMSLFKSQIEFCIHQLVYLCKPVQMYA